MRFSDVIRIVEEVRQDAYGAVEAPDPEKQTAFGFGRISGALQAIRQIEDRVKELQAQITEEEQQREE